MEKKFENDGLYLDEAGSWSERKHNLISQYADMFTSSMKNIWQCRVYLDLFASSGLALIKKTSRMVPTSQLLSLNIKSVFDKYIFCDIDKNKIDALKKRVDKYFPDANTTYICGDVNTSTGNILATIPKHSKSFKVLTFCVVDPYRLENLHFSTLATLSEKFMDFLVLIPSFMDANRNLAYYTNSENKHIENFLGYADWINDWNLAEKNGCQFGNFIVTKFNDRMATLGFLPLKNEELVLIRLPGKKVPLYHLAFYSRHKLGQKFWNEARSGSRKQLSLFE